MVTPKIGVASIFNVQLYYRKIGAGRPKSFDCGLCIIKFNRKMDATPSFEVIMKSEVPSNLQLTLELDVDGGSMKTLYSVSKVTLIFIYQTNILLE